MPVYSVKFVYADGKCDTAQVNGEGLEYIRKVLGDLTARGVFLDVKDVEDKSIESTKWLTFDGLRCFTAQRC